MLAMLLALLGGMAGIAAAGGGGGGTTKVSAKTQADQNNTSTAQAQAILSGDSSEQQADEDEDAQDQAQQDDSSDTEEQEEQNAAPVVDEPDPVEVVVDDGQNTGSSDKQFVTGEVVSGRVAQIELPNQDDIVSLKITENANFGNATINPDNTISLVLTGTTQTDDVSFEVEATDADGNVTTYSTTLEVAESTQEAGWGLGEFYMLETDENDDVIVEYGDNHREVYVSGDNNALSLEDIAAMENLDESDITGEWLLDHPEYGGSEAMALQSDAGMMLWSQMTGTGSAPSSDWLLFESGYEYNDLGFVLDRGSQGESELNPLYIGAYGEGDKPILNSQITMAQDTFKNVVIQGIEVHEGIKITTGENILLDDISFKNAGLGVLNVDNITLRNSDLYDIVREVPLNDGDIWEAHLNRMAGIFVNRSDGILLEGLFVDHVGWADDYEEDLSIDGGQPPSIYSHNLYLSYLNSDLTLRDTITSQGASYGAQVRSGGFIEDNVFLDNNVAVNFKGGLEIDGSDAKTGNYSLFADNVVTSGAHKIVTEGPKGGLTIGAEDRGNLTTLIDNIVTHLADPNNEAELDDKYVGHSGLSHATDPYYDDTIVYNWVGGREVEKGTNTDENTDGLNTDILDETTIQNFTAELLGDPDASISDLANYLRSQAAGELDDVVDADVIIAFFQEGFGLETDLRADAETLRFIPNQLGDGVRWDNRLNWDTDDLPGTQDGDSVDLGGNWVYYGGTTRLDDFDFGEGGQLNVTHGYLGIEGAVEADAGGGTFNIDNAGQVFLETYTDTDDLTINIDGGRFANTGEFSGDADLNVTDNAQVILADGGSTFALSGESELSITGGDAKVGFDGDDGDTAVVILGDDATLRMTAEDGAFVTIGEFRSGHYDSDTPNIESGIDLGGATFVIDLADLSGDSFSGTLISADELIGDFDEILVTGLEATQDAEVTIDYDTDAVYLNLSASGAGSGNISVSNVGDPDNAQLATKLWDALTDGQQILEEAEEAEVLANEDASDILLAM